MRDWWKPKSLMVVFTQRGGSTLLAHCLDNHPDIGFERGEPLVQKQIWKQILPLVSDAELLSIYLNRPGYLISGVRLNYRKFRALENYPQPDYMIHLYRENVVANMVSSTINARGNKGKLDHPVHTFEPVESPKIDVNISAFVKRCLRYLQDVKKMKEDLKGLDIPLLTLTYEQITGGGREVDEIPPDIAKKICQFVDVPFVRLETSLRKVNRRSPDEIINNWDRLEKDLRKAEIW